MRLIKYMMHYLQQHGSNSTIKHEYTQPLTAGLMYEHTLAVHRNTSFRRLKRKFPRLKIRYKQMKKEDIRNSEIEKKNVMKNVMKEK